MRACAARDLFFGNVDADDVAIRQELEQMSAAAADLEHARVRRNQVPVISREKFAIETTAARRFGRSGIKKRAKRLELFFKQRR